MRIVKVSKYKKLFSILLKSGGYLGPNIGSIDSSLYPYLIGKRGENSYYNLNTSVIGIKHLFDFLENVINDRGHVLLVGGPISLVSILLCLSLSKDSNLKVIPWNYSRVSNSFDQDFLIIHEIDKKAILEAYGQLLPVSGSNYPNVKGISYPVSIALEQKELSNWYSWALVASYRRGYCRRFRMFNEI